MVSGETTSSGETLNLVPAQFASCCDGRLIYGLTLEGLSLDLTDNITLHIDYECFRFVQYWDIQDTSGLDTYTGFQYVNCETCVDEYPCPGDRGGETPLPNVIDCGNTSIDSNGTDCEDSFNIYNVESPYDYLNGEYTHNEGESYNYLPTYTNGLGGFCFHNGSNWCLSDSLGGECFIQGTGVCPVFSNSFTTTTTTTTISDPLCSQIDFEAIFFCDDITTSPTPSPTPSVTPSPSVYIDPCDGFIDVVTSTTTTILVSPTPTPSPTQPFTDRGQGAVTFEICCSTFTCPQVNQIRNLSNNVDYFTSQRIIDIDGDVINFGEEFVGVVGGVATNYLYVTKVISSPNIFLEVIYSDESKLPSPTPSVTPSVTPTPSSEVAPDKQPPSVSPSNTPTPSVTSSPVPPDVTPSVTPTTSVTPSQTPPPLEIKTVFIHFPTL